MPVRNGIVYGLVHPDTQELRYVGITVKTAEERLREHIRNAFEYEMQYHVYRWMRQLPTHPVIVVIEENPENLFEAEKKWIATYRANGANLTNMTDGGDGTIGYEFSEEARERCRQAALARWERSEEKQKLSAWQTGRKHTPEHNAKIAASLIDNTRFAGHKWTPEAVAKRNANMLTRGTKAGRKVTESGVRHSGT